MPSSRSGVCRVNYQQQIKQPCDAAIDETHIEIRLSFIYLPVKRIIEQHRRDCGNAGKYLGCETGGVSLGIDVFEFAQKSPVSKRAGHQDEKQDGLASPAEIKVSRPRYYPGQYRRYQGGAFFRGIRHILYIENFSPRYTFLTIWSETKASLVPSRRILPSSMM